MTNELPQLHNAALEIAVSFLRTRKADIAQLIFVGLAQAGGNVIVLLAVKFVAHHLIARHASEPTTAQFLGIVALLIVFIVMRAFLDYQKKLRSERLGQQFAHATRVKILHRLKLVSARDLQRQGRGVMILRLSNDLTALRQWVTHGVARLVVAGISILVSLAALAALSIALAIPVAVVLVIGIAMSVLFGRPLGESVAEARRHRGRLSNIVSERVANMAAVQAHGDVGQEIENVARQSLRVSQTMIERARYSAALRAISEGTTAFASLSALLFGAYLSANGHIPASTALAALTVVGLLSAPVRDFERMYEYWYGADVAASKIRKLFLLPTLPFPEWSDGQPASGASLSVTNLSIGVIKNFSAEARPGDKVIIVGPPGCGKTTLCLTIAGLTAPEVGQVSVGGVSISRIERKQLRRLISISSPDVPLFRGSIRRNLAYRMPDAGADEIARICRVTGLEPLLSRLPMGLDTRLIEGGANLSHGERQHIALARALVGDPEIVVIDASQIQGNRPYKNALLELLSDYPGTVIIAADDEELMDCATTIWALGATRHEIIRKTASNSASLEQARA